MGMRNTKMWHEWLKFVRYIEDNQCFMCVYVYVWYVYVYMCMYVSIMCVLPCMCVYVPIHLCLCMYAHMRVYVFPRVWCVLVYVFNIDVWLNISVYLSFFLGFFFLRKGCRNNKHLNREGRFPHSKSASVVTHNLLAGAKLSMTETCTQYFARTLWSSFSFGAKLLRSNESWNMSSVLSWQKQGTPLGRWQLAACSQPHHIQMDAAFAHFTWSQEVPEWAGTCTHIDVL